MPSRFAARLTYANVLSTLAIFMILGGGAYAASALPVNSVGTQQIQRDGVEKSDINRDSIGPVELRADSVQSPDVKDGSLGCQDFHPESGVCQAPAPGEPAVGPEGPAGPEGPEGPAGPEGPTGGTAEVATVARTNTETLEVTCGEASIFYQDYYEQSCVTQETVRAECEPGEVATGGYLGEPVDGDFEAGPAGTYEEGDNRSTWLSGESADPAGQPTAWTAEARGTAYAQRQGAPPYAPTDPTISITVVCAS